MTDDSQTTRGFRRLRIFPWRILRWRLYAWLLLAVLLVYGQDYRPDDIALAVAPYRFSMIGWELGNLPDKWARRAVNLGGAFSAKDDDQRWREVVEYFEAGQRLAELERRLIRLEAETPASEESAREIAELRQNRAALTDSQARLHAGVEETVESAVADTLRQQGFGAWPGVFPPVDTALTGSPTVLILSPRERIERLDGAVLHTGVTGDQRAQIERRVESATELSALVVNTGGIALYPSIARNDLGLDFALETVAHEWVHHWLWFRPLGRRYFESGDLTALNETVATIAGREIGQLARHRLEGTEPQPPDHRKQAPAPSEPGAPEEPPRFDFQAEMRVTRVRVDEMLAAGEVATAEAYMEERRLVFVSEGYPIRKLNQAFFAFHGAYGTTGAAGVDVIGQQVTELRRRSSSLEDFLRAAAQITGPEDLAALLATPP